MLNHRELPEKVNTGKGNSSPRSDKQIAAIHRNFALFSLKGMLGHMHCIEGEVETSTLLKLHAAIDSAILEITTKPKE